MVHNPITDLVSHLMQDIEERNPKITSLLEHDQRHFDKTFEFGDPGNRLFYESHKIISPYHIPVLDESSLYTDLLVCVDGENPLKYHSRKLMGKLRQHFGKDNSWVFYKEFREQELSHREKMAYMQSFLINTLLFN